MITDELFKSIDNGREGLNKGLSTGLDKLDSLTYGIIRENITLVGASSGCGKSSITSYIAVYKAYCELLKSEGKIDIHWLIFSFEMSKVALFLRLLSMHLYDEYGLVVPHDVLLSLKSRMPDEIYEKVVESKEWIDGLAKRCIVIDKPVTAKRMYGLCKSFAEKHGKFVPVDKGTFKGEEWEAFDYVPDNKEQYLIVLVDHVKLFDTQTGHTSKQEIDEACKYLIYFRDKCKFSIYIVQQLNRGHMDMSRRTESGGVYQDVQLNDFSDTGDTVNASNTVLGMFFPAREKCSKWKGYLIDPMRGGLGSRGRSITLLKNRDGNSDKSIGLAFYGECHTWKELPKAEEITDYEQYKNP